MLNKLFRMYWDRERNKEAEKLRAILVKEIKSIRGSIPAEETHDSAYSLELKKLLADLLVRTALVDYEVEEIMMRRVEAQYTYFAFALSFAAFVFSVITFIYKH